MKMSNSKKEVLYKAVYEPIMNTRIRVLRTGSPLPALTRGEATEIDTLLHNLEIEIWKNIKETLNILD